MMPSHRQAARPPFAPLQPTAGAEHHAPLVYREFAPAPPLTGHVYCYWALQTNPSARAPLDYRIVADGCVDLFIDCAGFDRLTVAGTAASATVVAIAPGAAYFGIRFLPGRFTRLFPLPLKELAGTMVACRDVWGSRLDEWQARLLAAGSTRARVRVADDFLVRRLAAPGAPDDRRLVATLDTIYRHGGNLRLDRHAAHGVSPRQLRRLFAHHVGISPKTFARVVRFQSALRDLRQAPASDWAQRCLDFGYYDQAHFIHEFNTFYGISPSRIAAFPD